MSWPPSDAEGEPYHPANDIVGIDQHSVAIARVIEPVLIREKEQLDYEDILMIAELLEGQRVHTGRLAVFFSGPRPNGDERGGGA